MDDLYVFFFLMSVLLAASGYYIDKRIHERVLIRIAADVISDGIKSAPALLAEINKIHNPPHMPQQQRARNDE